MQGAQSQLAANIALLRSQHVNPMTVASDNEIASLDQGGDVNDKFDALGDYWDGYVNSRVLAYLGGFAAPVEGRERSGEQLARVAAVDVADERRMHVVTEELLQAFGELARDVRRDDEHVVLDRP